MKVNFEGGDLTSDAGLLLYKSFDHKLGFSKTVEELLVVNDNVIHRDHSNADVVIQAVYNAHYKQLGFHPLFCFDGLTGDCLKAELRPGNVYTSRDVASFMKPLFYRYKALTPHAFILVEGIVVLPRLNYMNWLKPRKSTTSFA